MLGSLFSGTSGIRVHQQLMEVIGNNLANVNTPGFKASRAVFSDMMRMYLSRGAAASDESGSVNPMQMGAGAKIASIDADMAQGALERTGRSLDLAIEGDSFFVVRSDGRPLYTRVGTFAIDEQNTLVDSATGYRVQSTQSRDIEIQREVAATPTSTVSLLGNLDASADASGAATLSIDVNDTLGRSHTVRFSMALSATPNQWDVTLSLPNGDGTIVSGGTQTITFNEDGSYDAITTSGTFEVAWDGLTTNQTLSIDPGVTGEFDGLTQLAGRTDATMRHDGFAAGSLLELSVSADGTVSGSYSNGRVVAFDQLQVATFTNPAGLARVGDSYFERSRSSGDAKLGSLAGTNEGRVVSGSLEGSNVDLAEELTRLITAQRGFQANARTVQTTDQILQELTSLTR